MKVWVSNLLFGLVVLLAAQTPARAQVSLVPNDLERRIELLFVQDAGLFETKLAIDLILNPELDIEKLRAEVAVMTAKLKLFVGKETNDHAKLKLLRKFIYEAGAWNDNRPFSYDMTDPLGANPNNKFLQHYLNTRKGNCVTMPLLLAILGRSIDLKMTLAMAPLHTFVKFTDGENKEWNIEATSGGGYTRDIWYRTTLPMTDLAVSQGTYLRALNPTETKARTALFLLEKWGKDKRPENVITAANVLLKHDPKLAYALVRRGSAYTLILRRDILAKYPNPRDMPSDVKAFADQLYLANRRDFQAAEQMGWTEQDGLK